MDMRLINFLKKIKILLKSYVISVQISICKGGGTLPSKDDISAIFTNLPPNKILKDKFLFGVYKSNKLIGIIDIIRDFPTIGEWTIGLLLLEPEERRKGLGIIIHEALVKWARHLGAKRFSIGVIEDNYRAFKF